MPGGHGGPTNRQLFSSPQDPKNRDEANCDNDEEEEDWEEATTGGEESLRDCDDLFSRMSVDDELSVLTGHRSTKQQRLGGRTGCHANTSTTTPGDSKTFSYGCTSIKLPYIMDIWRDTDPKDRCSVQVHLLSGRGGSSKLRARVSTDGRFLVLEGTSTNRSSACLRFFCHTFCC